MKLWRLTAFWLCMNLCLGGAINGVTQIIVRDQRLSALKQRLGRGTVNDDFVLNVDLAPTILAATGVTPPPRMQGHDFTPLYLDKPKPQWRDEYFDEYFYEHATIRNTDFTPSSQALVRKDIKYIYWPDFKTEELFDLKRDPHETRKVVNDAAYANQLARLRQRFATLKEQAK